MLTVPLDEHFRLFQTIDTGGKLQAQSGQLGVSQKLDTVFVAFFCAKAADCFKVKLGQSK